MSLSLELQSYVKPRPLYSYPEQTLHDTLPKELTTPRPVEGQDPPLPHGTVLVWVWGGRSSPAQDPFGPLPPLGPDWRLTLGLCFAVPVFAYRESTVTVRQWDCWELIKSLKKSKLEVKSSHQNIPRGRFLQNDYVTYWQMLQPGLKDRTDIHAIYIYTVILKWNVYYIASWPPSKMEMVWVKNLCLPSVDQYLMVNKLSSSVGWFTK